MCRSILEKNITTKYYKHDEDRELSVFCNGLIVFVKNNERVTDLLKIAHAVIDSRLDYNNLQGFYRIVIVEKETKKIVCFGDNSGSQRFFFDKETGDFADSLLALINLSGREVTPNYSAIYQMLSYGGIFTNDTLVENIFRTDSEKVYTFADGNIQEDSKNLKSLTLNKGKKLGVIMQTLTDGIDNQEVCAVCTGGTDSRTILAHLVSAKVAPELIITGHKENPDIPIAREIARVLNLPLTIMDPDAKEQDWIQKGFLFSDGLYDVVLSYRHLKKVDWAIKNGFKFEFGGVGGEFYKNVYARPFRDKLLFKKVTKNHAIEILFEKRMNQCSWIGESLAKVKERSKQDIISIIQSFDETGTLHIMNRIGNRILQNRYSLICNNAASRGLCKVEPLVSRDSIASVSKKSPLHLTMHIWQRREINEYCNVLSDIATDQGYSCTIKGGKLTKERVKKLAFYTSRVIARLRKRMGLSFKKSEQEYWDNDYVMARNTEVFKASIETCKKLGIMKENVTENMIANKYVGNIILIGLLFAE